MPYLMVIVALVLLVVVHELGHFLAARAVGIRATKFYVFFPPAAAKKQVGDVEYGIGWLPLGGFVKLPGMFEPEPAHVGERVKYEFDQLPPLSGDDALTASAARRRMANASTPDELIAPLDELVEVAERCEDSPKQQAVVRRLRDMQDDLHPRAYWRAALWRRMTVILAGPAVNLVVAALVLCTFYWVLIPRYETTGPMRVAAVSKDSPAADAGITKKTRIYAWNGTTEGIDTAKLAERISDSLGKPTKLTFAEPGHEKVTKTLQPRVLHTSDGEASDGPRLGLAPYAGDLEVAGRRTTDLSFAAKATGYEIRDITWGNLKALPQVFYKSEVRKQVNSVVGIVQVARDVDKAGMFIRYIGLISLILAVMNLLPLLPLDGGHVLFGIIEAIRRRPLPRMAFERYSMVGFALVIVLFLIGLNNDIGSGA
jgi:regulator of sigma E protease